jgi:glutamine synthetase
VQNKFSPGDPLDKDIYHLADVERGKLKQMPSSLDAALNSLSQDHEFLMRGDVFTEDVIQAWLKHKRENDVAALRSRPHPFEFCMYFDA